MYCTHLFAITFPQGADDLADRLRPVLCHCFGERSGGTCSNVRIFILYAVCQSTTLHGEPSKTTHQRKEVWFPRTLQVHPYRSLPIYGGPISHSVHRHRDMRSISPETSQGLSGRMANVA